MVDMRPAPLDGARARSTARDQGPTADPYRLFFELAPDAVIIVDDRGVIVDANRQAETMFGYSVDELVGTLVEALLPEEARTAHIAHRAGFAGHPRRRPMGAGLDLSARRSDGTSVAVDISLSPLPGSLYAAAVRDVTTRRAAEEALRSAHARAERTAEALLAANEELRLRAAVAEHLGEGVALVRAADGVIVYTNERWDELFGHVRGELVGQAVTSLTVSGAPTLDELDVALAAHTSRAAVWAGEVQNMRKDGTRWWAQASISGFVHPEHGQVWISVHQDVTERRRALEAAEESEARFRSVFDVSPIGMAVVDSACRFVSANAALCELLGYSAAQLAGRSFADVTPGDDAHRDVDLVAEAFAGSRRSFTLQKRYLHASGRVVWAEVRVARLPGADEQRAVLMITDITAHKQAEEDLAHRALHDELTGVANRALALERLGQALARVARGDHGVGVLFADLDEFKAVNDRLGHGVGDQVLREAANRIASVVRPYDTVARLGGDEFVVVCDGLPADRALARMQLMALAERLRRAVAAPIAVGHETVTVTASVGGAAADGRAPTSPGELLDRADRALYAAKEAGRDRAHWAGVVEAGTAAAG